MNQANAILGLLAETSIHAGAGQKLGAVDLPIQREAHTDWPCIYGTAVKGALRARAHEANLPNLDEVVVFGPDVQDNNASDHAGALLVGDARLLLLPVRSLTGTFKWVTCPAVLRRFHRDQRRLGVKNGHEELPLPAVKAEHATVPTKPEGKEDLFLEEYRLTLQEEPMEPVLTALSRFLPEGERHSLKERLCLVEDEFFGYLARFATPVTAHVSLNSKTKTAKDGQLRYEESLPPETLFYVPLSASPARKKDASENDWEILDAVVKHLLGRDKPYLQVGGNETVGMGWCRVTAVTAPRTEVA